MVCLNLCCSTEPPIAGNTPFTSTEIILFSGLFRYSSISSWDGTVHDWRLASCGWFDPETDLLGADSWPIGQ
jgi:hypothetical protein